MAACCQALYKCTVVFLPIVDTRSTMGQFILPNYSGLRVRYLRESCWTLGKDNVQVLGQPILRYAFQSAAESRQGSKGFLSILTIRSHFLMR